MDTTRRGFLVSTAAAGLAAAATPPPPVLGCATLPYGGQPLARALEGIRRAGYRHILPFATHQQQRVFTPALTAAERTALRRQFADAGLEPNLAFAGLGVRVKDPKTLDVFLAELDLAREFGIRTVIGIGPSYFTKMMAAMLERAVRHAETLAVTIAVKPHTGITATARACMDVIQRIPSERLKICWDAGNVSFYEGIGPDPDLPELVPHLRVVCLKDHRGLRGNADFPIPGTGQVDHPAMFKILFAGGYRGPFYIERIDGTDDASRMPPDVIDQRLQQAREIIAPMLETARREVTR
ncbi:MAG: sugar phosphate isomerase/epimerase [Acidobacteria bacterium]|nr:sugar phosphate isomerase/epimerase [Acidobacteriota bacterium]